MAGHARDPGAWRVLGGRAKQFAQRWRGDQRVRGGGPYPPARRAHHPLCRAQAGRERPQAGCARDSPARALRLAHQPAQPVHAHRAAGQPAGPPSTLGRRCARLAAAGSGPVHQLQRCPRQRDGRPAAVRRGLAAGRAAGPARFAGSCGGGRVWHCAARPGHRRHRGRPPRAGVRRPDPASLCAPPGFGRLWRRGPAGLEHWLDAVPARRGGIAAGCHGARGHRPAPGQACGRRPVGLF